MCEPKLAYISFVTSDLHRVVFGVTLLTLLSFLVSYRFLITDCIVFLSTSNGHNASLFGK